MSGYTIAHKASVLTFLNILSPVAGLTVEIILAWVFGSSAIVDAYRVVSVIVVFSTQLFFSQMMTNILVPKIMILKSENNTQNALTVVFSLAFLVTFFTCPIILLSVVRPDLLVGFLGPGLNQEAALAASHMITFYTSVFVIACWSGVINAFLHSYHIFWLPAVGQLIINLSLIFSMLCFSRLFEEVSLGFGVFVGSFLGLVLFFTYLVKIVTKEQLDLKQALLGLHLDNFILSFKTLIQLLSIVFASIWFVIIMNRVLSELPEGVLANFGYAWKVMLLVSIVPTAISTVVFPSLNLAWLNHEQDKFFDLIIKVFSVTLLIAMPITIIIYVCRYHLVYILFSHGAMTTNNLQAIANIIAVLVWSAPLSLLLGILYKICYSINDVNVPLIVQIITAITTTFMVSLFADLQGVIGVALFYGLLQLFILLGLFSYLFIRLKEFKMRSGSVFLIVFQLLFSGITCLLIALYMEQQMKLDALLEIIILVPTVFTIFLMLSIMFKIPGIKDLRDYTFIVVIKRFC
jgi:putative peptidoglycan lipid II flippase